MVKKSVRIMVTAALLAAMSVVFRLFLGYPQTGTTRYDLGFLPIAAAGMMFGPIWSGITYVIADLIGTIGAAQVPFIPITACKFVFGFIFGLFFYKKELSIMRILLCVLTISVVVDLVCMPLALYPLYNKGVIAILMSRITQVAVMLPVRTLSIWLMNKYLGKYMKKYYDKI